MARFQFSVRLRNARLDVIESVPGVSPIMKIMGGEIPADCSQSDGANPVLCTINLPSDWMTAASDGQKSMSGAWQDQSADLGGTISYWRLWDNGGANCDMQGDAGLSGSGASMIVDAIDVVAGQYFSVTSCVLSEANQ